GVPARPKDESRPSPEEATDEKVVLYPYRDGAAGARGSAGARRVGRDAVEARQPRYRRTGVPDPGEGRRRAEAVRGERRAENGKDLPGTHGAPPPERRPSGADRDPGRHHARGQQGDLLVPRRPEVPGEVPLRVRRARLRPERGRAEEPGPR